MTRLELARMLAAMPPETQDRALDLLERPEIDPQEAVIALLREPPRRTRRPASDITD